MVRAISRTLCRVVPALRARSAPAWITGPSAIGSEKGTPNSMRSTPPRSSAVTICGVRSGDGSPAVMYAIKAARFWDLRAANRGSIRVGIKFWQIFAVDVGVFVAASGKIDDIDLPLGRGGALDDFRDGVRGFERRDD